MIIIKIRFRAVNARRYYNLLIRLDNDVTMKMIKCEIERE